jgi:hypothetical protein
MHRTWHEVAPFWHENQVFFALPFMRLQTIRTCSRFSPMSAGRRRAAALHAYYAPSGRQMRTRSTRQFVEFRRITTVAPTNAQNDTRIGLVIDLGQRKAFKVAPRGPGSASPTYPVGVSPRSARVSDPAFHALNDSGPAPLIQSNQPSHPASPPNSSTVVPASPLRYLR